MDSECCEQLPESCRVVPRELKHGTRKGDPSKINHSVSIGLFNEHKVPIPLEYVNHNGKAKIPAKLYYITSKSEIYPGSFKTEPFVIVSIQVPPSIVGATYYVIRVVITNGKNRYSSAIPFHTKTTEAHAIADNEALPPAKKIVCFQFCLFTHIFF